MEKDYRTKKYAKNNKPNRHRGRRLKYRMHSATKYRRDKSKRRRYLLNRYIRDERRHRDEQSMRALNFNYESIYLEDGYTDGICDCEGYYDDGQTVCPYGGFIHISNPTPVSVSFPVWGKYVECKYYK